MILAMNVNLHFANLFPPALHGSPYTLLDRVTLADSHGIRHSNSKIQVRLACPSDTGSSM